MLFLLGIGIGCVSTCLFLKVKNRQAEENWKREADVAYDVGFSTGEREGRYGKRRLQWISK